MVSDQYKQSFLQFKTPMALDTITTRFLLLFVFTLAIPLITVIIFTVSLLASHVDEAATGQMVISQSLFDHSVNEAQDRLAMLETVTSATDSACQRLPSILCLHYDTASGTVEGTNGRKALSDLKVTAPELLGHPNFFALWDDHLALLSRSNGVKASTGTLHGLILDDAFLNGIYRQQPILQTEMWLLKEPIDPAHPRWLARSPKGASPIPAGILRQIAPMNLSQPVTVTIDQNGFRVLQEPVYSLSNEKIARIIHILPLSQNQMLLTNYYVGIYIITVASLIFSVLVAMLAGRTITQPLLKLISQVNTLSRESVMKDEVQVSGVREIRQLGEAFNHMIKRLGQEHKMKDEFVATLTHDLKVPLLAEKQTLAYFRKQTYGPLTEDQAEVLEVLQSSNGSCLSLVNGLLEVYRYDAGEVSLIFEQFNLSKLLSETANEIQALAREKSLLLEISTDLPEDSEENMVYADRLEIKRVLHNLISNAITNTPLHGQIKCHLTDAQHHGSDTVYKVSGFQHTTLKYPVKLTERILVTIQDSGVGFSTEDLPSLFKQFAASRGRNPMSIGLGLYNCHQVIAAHNGALWVESTEGEGSAISFVLPQNKEAARDRRVYHDRRRRG